MIITGILSAIIYGLWAYYVNMGLPTVVASSLAQAGCSFIGGWLVAGMVEFTFRHVRKPFRFPVAAFVPYALTLLTYALVHKLVGTPEIFKTILLNIMIGTPYFVLYCVKLEKLDSQKLLSGIPTAEAMQLPPSQVQ